MGSALETLCGQAFGAGQIELLGVYLQRSWIILVASCFCIMPLYIFSTPILKLLGQRDDIAELAGKFSIQIIPQMFSLAINFPTQKFLQAQSNVAILAWVGFMALAMHIGVLFLFIKVFRWGVTGAAAAYDVSAWAIALAQVVYIVGWCKDSWKGLSWLALKELWPFVKLSVASAVMICLEIWYFMTIIVLTGHLEDPVIAVGSLSICMNLNGWEGMLFIGINAAISVRVSNELGSGHPRAAKYSVFAEPSIEHLIQAKFGQMSHQGPQNDLMELLSRAKHGQLHPLEQQVRQQEQAHERLRQRLEMDEDRQIGAVWPVDETGQYLRNPGVARRANSGFGPLDIYQQQQIPPPEEHVSHLERNLSMQDRLQRGLYDTGFMPLERTMSVPGGGPGVSLDAVNPLVHAQGLEMQDPNSRMHSAGHMPGFSTGIHLQSSHRPLFSNQFHAPNVDTIENHWSERNGQLPPDWMDTRMQQLHLNGERQRRDFDVRRASEDQSMWMSAGANDDSSKRLLMELLQQKSGQQSTEQAEMTRGILFERGLHSGHFSVTNASNRSFNPLLDQDTSLNQAFTVGSYGSNSDLPPQRDHVNEIADSLDVCERLPFKSHSGDLAEAQPVFSSINDASQVHLEARESIVRQAGVTTVEGEMPINLLSRHTALGTGDCNVFKLSSCGSLDFYNDKSDRGDSAMEEIPKERMAVTSKRPDNILPKRPPVLRISSTQEGLSEINSDSLARGKNPSDGMASEGGKREAGGNAANQVPGAATSVKKDGRFRRTASCSDADVSETSFSDMLKSNAKKPTAQEAHASEAIDATHRSGKKKGKKGRQIDPALLGFKVTSNRIMMGEIQRIED